MLFVLTLSIAFTPVVAEALDALTDESTGSRSGWVKRAADTTTAKPRLPRPAIFIRCFSLGGIPAPRSRALVCGRFIGKEDRHSSRLRNETTMTLQRHFVQPWKRP